MFHDAEAIPPPDYTFTISVRGKSPELPVFQFLRRHFGHVLLNRSETLFGFVEYTPLHGGRALVGRELPGMIDFDLEPLITMGFRNFKLLRRSPVA